MKKPEGQPIPFARIQAHYAPQLEIDLAVLRAQQQIAALVIPAQAAFANTCRAYVVKPDDWNFDLKTGVMTPKVSK